MSYLKQMNMKSYYYLSLMLCALSAGVSAQEITKSTDVESERTLSADSIITQDKQLDSLYQSLPEVMITGQRPIVKAEQGKLVYDLPRLIGNLPVDNAYDAVEGIAGRNRDEWRVDVGRAGGNCNIGWQSYHHECRTALFFLLKSIPSSRIEKGGSDVQCSGTLSGAGCTHQYHTETKHRRPVFLAGRALWQI